MADNFDWKRIRALNGSQSSGFEELCAQLALEERPTDSEFRRKGSPDAGIECFCILRGGSEWGWQAKFFDTLKNPQWSQLNESVKKALDKHPALVRYYVCIPLNRADPRVAGKEFAMDLWHKHVRTWESWAQERNMEVEFEWWGSTELLDMLTQEKNIGRRFFWFGDRGFSKEWFKGNLKLALDSAGPRYTPPIHVDLPVALDMERFGGSGLLVEEVKF